MLLHYRDTGLYPSLPEPISFASYNDPNGESRSSLVLALCGRLAGTLEGRADSGYTCIVYCSFDDDYCSWDVEPELSEID